MTYDLEELRARVERKRRAAEHEALMKELRGQTEVTDPDVIYLTAKEVAKKLGVKRNAVLYWIKCGRLKARKGQTRMKGGKLSWVVHPEDLKKFEEIYVVRTAPELE
jgi:hypothetical protein